MVSELQWNNEDDYKYTEKLTLFGWAWEFIRRNPEYQDDYGSTLPIKDAQNKWHLKNWYHPDRFFENDVDFMTEPILPVLIPTLDHLDPFLREEPVYDRNHDIEIDIITVVDNKYGVIAFDLERSFDEQIKKAEKILNDYSAEMNKLKKPENTKRKRTIVDQHESWHQSIRVLDAIEQGVSSAQISYELNYNADAHAKKSRSPGSQGYALVKKATGWRDYRYKKILMKAYQQKGNNS